MVTALYLALHGRARELRHPSSGRGQQNLASRFFDGTKGQIDPNVSVGVSEAEEKTYRSPNYDGLVDYVSRPSRRRATTPHCDAATPRAVFIDEDVHR